MPINGTVQATGEFAPSSSGDTYAILDARYMRDGFRNVDTVSDLDLITEDRRTAGMVVGVSGGTAYYKLNQGPWVYTFSDWTDFNPGSGSTLSVANGLTLTGDTIILGGVLTGDTTITSTSTEKLIVTDSDGVVLQSRDSNGIFKLAEYTPSVYTGSSLVIDCFSSGNYYENSNVILNFAGSFQTYTNSSSVYNFGTSNVYTSSNDINNWGGSNSFLTASTIFNLGVGNSFTNNNAVSIFGNGNILDNLTNTTVLGNNNTYSGLTYSDKFILGNANNNLIIDGVTGIIISTPTLINSGLTGTLIGITSTGDFYNTNINLTNLIFTGGTVTGNTYFTANVTASTFSSLLISNTRLRKRFVSVASSATPAVNTDNGDVFSLTGLSTNITNASTYLTGTPTHGDLFSLELTDNGVARTISWGASFSNTGTLSLPTTTVISTLLRCLFQYNSVTTKWEIVAVV